MQVLKSLNKSPVLLERLINPVIDQSSIVEGETKEMKGGNRMEKMLIYRAKLNFIFLYVGDFFLLTLTFHNCRDQTGLENWPNSYDFAFLNNKNCKA